MVALPLPLGLAAAILRDRLFDIDVVVNRTLVYGGLTLGVVVTYVVVTSAAGAVVGSEHGSAVSLLATAIAALAALPLRDLLQRSVNRLMYGQRDEPWRAMRRLGQRLEWAADPDRAFPAIVETVAEALRLPYVALEVIDVTGEDAIVAEVGSRQPTVTTMPLAHGAEPVGRLVLGIRPGERGFRADEVALVEDLARQAGAAIHALRLRDDLAQSHERLVIAREEERRRLRRDLHDGLGPTLASIGMRAEASAETLATDPANARRLLDELGGEVRTALAEIRRLVDGLRPPALDELGLLVAIEQQAGRLEGGAGLAAGTRIIVDRPVVPLPELPAAVEVAAYRIVVEALTNVVRHADARTCQVRIRAGDDLTIEVDDDGRGLPRGPASGDRDRSRCTGAPRSSAGPSRSSRVPGAAYGSSPGCRSGRPWVGDRARGARGWDGGSMTDLDAVTRVLIADDHASFRSGLRALLETAGDMTVVGEAGTGDEAVARTIALQPDVVLMDLNMPGMDGLEATRRIVERRRTSPCWS